LRNRHRSMRLSIEAHPELEHDQDMLDLLDYTTFVKIG
jgi:hypothetical protein